MKRLILALFALTLLSGCDLNGWHPEPYPTSPELTHTNRCAFGYPGEDCRDLKK